MIAAIEDAIKARLAAAKLPYVRSIASYSGQFDGKLAEVVRNFPAFWVFFRSDGPGKASSTSRSMYLTPATFVLLAGARNLRSEEARRKGGPGVREIGCYQMLADARALLLGQDLDLEITPLTPGRTQLLFNGQASAQGVSVIAQDWHTTYPQRVARAAVLAPGGTLPSSNETDQGSHGLAVGEAVPGGSGSLHLPLLPPLERIGLNYHLQPDDGLADAVDLVTLQHGRATQEG